MQWRGTEQTDPWGLVLMDFNVLGKAESLQSYITGKESSVPLLLSNPSLPLELHVLSAGICFS